MRHTNNSTGDQNSEPNLNGLASRERNFGTPSIPEILAPAGNEEMLKAAVENGADAVYFGVREFNARLRADNFSIETLPQIMSDLHARGVRGYLTFNILIFNDELEEAVHLLRACSRAGIDAVLIQDLGLAYLAKQLVPELPVHASTQMTLNSAEAILGAEQLGLSLERVVTGRELSLRELGRLVPETTKEIEVFVHGALCVAYSGQCLTSEALGGRSANRGECAQACRLPYELIVDGEHQEVENLRYLLSPKDLAAHQDVEELMELGIVSLKIEGRLKTPEYVAATVQAYHRARELALAGKKNRPLEPHLVRQLEATFSRGFTKGYLHEINHQSVVEGRFPTKRGTFLGTVSAVKDQGIFIKLEAPLKLGDGIVFDSGHPEKKEEGGRVYELFLRGKAIKHYDTDHGDASGAILEVRLENNKIRAERIYVGDHVWKTSDPKIDASLRQSFESTNYQYHRPVDAFVRAHCGSPLELRLTDWEGLQVTVQDSEILEKARTKPLDHASLLESLDRFGNTPFYLRNLSVDIMGEPMCPLSRLNHLRREAARELEAKRRRLGTERIQPQTSLSEIRERLIPNEQPNTTPNARCALSVLCRSLEQIDAALACRAQQIYVDLEDINLLKEASQMLRGKANFIPASLRIFKPGETPMVRKLLTVEPSAVLIRNLASWQILRESCPDLLFIADYSLNIANDITARLLKKNGFARLTPSYDLNFEQLRQLLCMASPEWFEVTLHQHMPMFHMEHCVFCRFLSSGHNSSDCGRPCEKHEVRLRDRTGIEHLLKADFSCRNTVFHGKAQSGIEYFSGLRDLGVQSFRVDLLDESFAQAQETLALYQSVFSGERSERELWKDLHANSKLGVTRGTLDYELSQSNESIYQMPKRKQAHGKSKQRPSNGK